MSRAKDVRERWITEVLRTDAINDGCKLVLIAMSRHMTEKGRVSYPRERIAAEVGLKTPQRVTNRIKEARDAGLLDVVHSGYRGMTAVYEAMIPAPGKGARSEHPNGEKGNGQRAPFSEHPFSGANPVNEAGKGARSEHPNAGAHVRATKTNHEREPAPGDSREERDHAVTSQAGTYEEWLPTPLRASSSDSTERVA
ncbi:hypothetical protein [Modestobacter sp. SYSU DS0875]